MAWGMAALAAVAFAGLALADARRHSGQAECIARCTCGVLVLAVLGVALAALLGVFS